MSQPTQTYKRSLSGSIGAGMGAVFNAKGRTYYILEHKVSSKYHRAGEAQEIIVDQIEIGRGPKCQVRFDSSFTTVSRRHAAIVRDGQNWKLIQLSNTNTTFLNGRPVQNEWYLQNGDEIQLSVNGPKLGFIVPSGNKSTVGSIGLSRRLSLFRQQALRPYKTAMAVLATLLVLAIAGGTGGGVYLAKENGKLVIDIDITKAELERLRLENDSILEEAKKQEEQYQRELAKQAKRINSLEEFVRAQEKDTTTHTTPIVKPSTDNSIRQCQSNVYYIEVSNFVLSNGREQASLRSCFLGTGFLLDDGRFVTARHVVQPWMYPSNDEMKKANKLLTNGMCKISYSIDAYSPDGKHLSLSPSQVKINTTSDRTLIEEGDYYTKPTDRTTDWAYFNTSLRGGLHYDNTLSENLKMQDKLAILGYPKGLGVHSNDITPFLTEGIVARDGLENGLIMTTTTQFEHGNSGGPVFVTNKKGEMIVVGIVSAGSGSALGLIVPIASAHSR